jgi:hypothetical protein
MSDPPKHVGSSDARVWNLLGLEIARKTELLAFAAFLLSLSAAVWQVVNYFKGPVVRIFASDQVSITTNTALGRTYEAEKKMVRFVATMSYVNEGDVGRSGTVRREYLRFAVKDRTYEHRWYEFVSSDIKGGKLQVERISEARPLTLLGGGSASHETLFAPWETECAAQKMGCDTGANFVSWDKFLEDIKATKRVVISTSADVYLRSSVSASCIIALRDWEIEILEKEELLTATCE